MLHHQYQPALQPPSTLSLRQRLKTVVGIYILKERHRKERDIAGFL
jgi:ribosomal protein L34